VLEPGSQIIVFKFDGQYVPVILTATDAKQIEPSWAVRRETKANKVLKGAEWFIKSAEADS